MLPPDGRNEGGPPKRFFTAERYQKITTGRGGGKVSREKKGGREGGK